MGVQGEREERKEERLRKEEKIFLVLEGGCECGQEHRGGRTLTPDKNLALTVRQQWRAQSRLPAREFEAVAAVIYAVSRGTTPDLEDLKL
eukprot:796313-Rhodomonas_salina.1